MTADVIEAAELFIGTANDEQGLAHELSGEVIAGLGDPFVVSDDLPGAGEDLVLLLRGGSGIDVEGGGKGPGARDVGIDVERVEWGHGPISWAIHIVRQARGTTSGRPLIRRGWFDSGGSITVRGLESLVVSRSSLSMMARKGFRFTVRDRTHEPPF